MKIVLTRYEKFVIMVQSNSLSEARKICGDDIVLKQALLFLTSNYYLK